MESNSSLDWIVRSIPADQIEKHLWERTFEQPHGEFLKAMLDQIGQTGGTIHQVRDSILGKKKGLLDGFGHVDGLTVGTARSVPDEGCAASSD